MKTTAMLMLSIFFVLTGVGQFALLAFYSRDASLKRKYYAIARQTGEIRGQRGAILDRNEQILAYSTSTFSGTFDWAKLDDARRNKLKDILQKMHSPMKWENGVFPTPLEIKLLGTSGKMQAERSPELNWVFEEKRYYPYGERGGAVVGAWRKSGSVSGVEIFLDPFLSGKTSLMGYFRKTFGTPVPGTEKFDPGLNGLDVVLTVDQNLQILLGDALKEGVQQAEAKAGSGILLDLTTGEILAVEHYPFFHPERFSVEYPSDLPYNPMPLSYAFEPGSTFKPITIAIALELGKIPLDEKITCHQPRKVADTYVREFREYHGVVNWEDILIVSCNVGASVLGERIEEQEWKSYFRNFGFSSFGLQEYEEPFFALPERKVLLEDRVPLPSQYTAVDRSRFGFGQGISVTLLRLVKAYTVFPYRGEMLHPCLVKQVRNHEREVLWKCRLKKTRVIKNPQVTDYVMQALRKVVISPKGTGKRAGVPGYVIAGKTGTAQIYDRNIGDYSHENLIVSFIGFLGYRNSTSSGLPVFQYILGISLVEPKYSPEVAGGLYAAPIFRNFASALLWYNSMVPEEGGKSPNG